MRFAHALAAGALIGGLVSGPAVAAPAVAPSGLVAGDAVTRVVEGPHRHLRHTCRTDEAYRIHRRRNTHLHGNPNAQNPEREGYQQLLGDTTNGPRY